LHNLHSSAPSVTNIVLNVQTETPSLSLPDEVGTVTAERRLFEETSDKRVFFDAVDVLLTQSSSPLDAASRPTAAHRRRGATVRGTSRRRGGRGRIFVVDGVTVHCVTHREPSTISPTTNHRALLRTTHNQTRSNRRVATDLVEGGWGMRGKSTR